MSIPDDFLSAPRLIWHFLLLSIVPGISAQTLNGTPYPLLLPDTSQLEALSSVKVYGDFTDIRVRPSAELSAATWTVQPINPDVQSSTLINGLVVNSGPVVAVSDGALVIRANSDVLRYALDLTLPAHWTFQLQIYGAGNMDIRGVAGALTAWSARGDINVLEHSGSLSLTAMDGEVDVQFVGDALAGTSAITMNHGVIGRNTLQVALPETFRATLQVQAGNKLRSNVPALKNVWSVAPVATGANADAELNGGGAVLTLRNLNGDIQINSGVN